MGFVLQLILGNAFINVLLFYKGAWYIKNTQKHIHTLTHTRADNRWWVKMIRWICVILFPPFNFAKCFYDISALTSPVYDTTVGNPHTDKTHTHTEHI